MSHLQNLLLDTLLGTKHVDSAALIKIQERSLCVASPGFNIMPSDVRTLVNGFAKDPLQTRREGLYFKEKDYRCVRADEYSLYAKNENTGVVVVKTHLYLLVATYTEGMYPSVCVEATESLETGQYSPPPEASNIATFWASRHMAKLGPGCWGHWKIGDAAMALPPGGGQAQYVTVPEGLLVPIPEGLTLPQAAAIPEAWLTTLQLLHYVGEENPYPVEIPSH
ncbi:hypothetical protein H8959_013562 [Pygathrix nigripes]